MAEQHNPGAMTAPVTEMMKQGLAVMRVEDETLQAMAIQRPRDVSALADKAIAELRAFPDFAKKAYYCIPYKDANSPTGKTMIEGPSIKAANALLRHWGNNSSGFRIVGADEERIMIQGVFVDHETGMRRTSEISVSRKAYNKTTKSYYDLPPDRLNMSIQAGGSKAVRNAALNAMPVGLVEAYFAEAKRIAARGGKADAGPAQQADLDHAQEALFKAFENLDVARAEVTGYIERHPELTDIEMVNAHLAGVLNSLNEGMATIEEVFTVPTGEAPLQEPQRKAPASHQTGPNAGVKPPVPAKAREMPAKFDNWTCDTCKQKGKQGEAIVYIGDTKKAYHRSHYA